MPQLTLKPSHKAILTYYDCLAKFEKLGIKHEGAVRSAFQELLEGCGRQFDWKLVPEYRVKTKAGKQVLHLDYEQQAEFKLQRIENKQVPLDWRVETMRLTKDRTGILYNDFLTLSGVPVEVFDYKLGNRSALEWIIDQYRVTRDQHGNIVSDPNRSEDEQYIVRLIGQRPTPIEEFARPVIQALPPESPDLKFEI